MLDIDDYELDAAVPAPSPPREELPALTQMDENLGVEDLGVDEAVKTRAHQPRAKLDASRMLNVHKGIPSLPGNMSRIHFKGKNHERRDLIKLLGAYQMWAHRLFPKANFDDFLVMCARAGHDPQIRGYRRRAIDNEKYFDGSAPVRDVQLEPEHPSETSGEPSWLEIAGLEEEIESSRLEPTASTETPTESRTEPRAEPKSTTETGEREINSDEEAAMAEMYDDLGF